MILKICAAHFWGVHGGFRGALATILGGVPLIGGLGLYKGGPTIEGLVSGVPLLSETPHSGISSSRRLPKDLDENLERMDDDSSRYMPLASACSARLSSAKVL